MSDGPTDLPPAFAVKFWPALPDSDSDKLEYACLFQNQPLPQKNCSKK